MKDICHAYSRYNALFKVYFYTFTDNFLTIIVKFGLLIADTDFFPIADLTIIASLLTSFTIKKSFLIQKCECMTLVLLGEATETLTQEGLLILWMYSQLLISSLCHHAAMVYWKCHATCLLLETQQL